MQYTIDNAAMIGFTGYLKFMNSENKNYFSTESFKEKPLARIEIKNF